MENLTRVADKCGGYNSICALLELSHPVNHPVNRDIDQLSRSEVQHRVLVHSLALAFGKATIIYPIDQPSAPLDSKQSQSYAPSGASRLYGSVDHRAACKCAKRAAFVVEHDFIIGRTEPCHRRLATYLADRVVFYYEQPGVECTAKSSESLLSGMNCFLKRCFSTLQCHRITTDENRPEGLAEGYRAEGQRRLFLLAVQILLSCGLPSLSVCSWIVLFLGLRLAIFIVSFPCFLLIIRSTFPLAELIKGHNLNCL